MELRARPIKSPTLSLISYSFFSLSSLYLQKPTSIQTSFGSQLKRILQPKSFQNGENKVYWRSTKATFRTDPSPGRPTRDANPSEGSQTESAWSGPRQQAGEGTASDHKGSPHPVRGPHVRGRPESQYRLFKTSFLVCSD